MADPWKDSYPILEPSSWDDEIARRRYGALRAEFHNLSAFRYNNAPLSSKGASDTGIHLGLLGVLYATAEQAPGEKNQMPCDGPIDAQFVYSRDGDAFDRGMIIGTAKEPILGGDEVHWYYTGCEHTHGELEMEKRVKRLGRATWRRDRFVALAAAGEGMVVTKPLLPPPWPGYALEINADAAGGQLRVELCGRDGRALEGFSREDCTTLQTDDMHWKNPLARFPTGAYDPVQLRFLLNRSKLYSFKF